MATFAKSLTFNEIFDLIRLGGNSVTFMVQGEPGIGKTSLGKALAQKLGYHFAYMDIANMSLGDLMMPVTNHDLKSTEFYPNEIFGLHEGKPVVVMMDEWTKGSREVKNMTLPLALERRIGCVKLHPDSIVFATGNLTGDGVGDSIQAHQMDRFVMVEMKKPDSEKWINEFAIQRDVDPTVIAFANEFPQVFQSYKDDPQNENGYIFNPRSNSGVFCSPRSLEFASHIVKCKEHVTPDALHAALAGAIGPSAAAELVSFVSLSEELPPLASIVADPKKCALPQKPVTRLLLVFNLIMRAEKDNLTAIITYIRRMENEMQGIFVNKILKTPSKAAWAHMNKALEDLCLEKNYLFG